MEKRKRKRKRKLAKRRAITRQTKPKAGDVLKYFQQVNPELHSDYIFVLIPRVSKPKQLENYSEAEQFWTMREFARKNNLKLLPIDYHVQCSSMWRKEPKEFLQKGFDEYPKSCPNPKTYKPHYEILKEIVYSLWIRKQQNPVVKYALLFLSVNRAVRSDDYDCKYNKDAELTSEELEMFLSVTKPFPSFVICHPSWSESRIDKWRKRYGVIIEQEQPRQKGDLKRRYKKYHNKVIELRAKGLSYGKIAKEENLPIELVRSWCRKAKMKGFL